MWGGKKGVLSTKKWQNSSTVTERGGRVKKQDSSESSTNLLEGGKRRGLLKVSIIAREQRPHTTAASEKTIRVFGMMMMFFFSSRFILFCATPHSGVSRQKTRTRVWAGKAPCAMTTGPTMGFVVSSQIWRHWLQIPSLRLHTIIKRFFFCFYAWLLLIYPNTQFIFHCSCIQSYFKIPNIKKKSSNQLQFHHILEFSGIYQNILQFIRIAYNLIELLTIYQNICNSLDYSTI